MSEQETRSHTKGPYVIPNLDVPSETSSVFENRLLKSMIEALIKSTEFRHTALITGDAREGLRGPTPPFDGNAQKLKARLLGRKGKEGKGK